MAIITRLPISDNTVQCSVSSGSNWAAVSDLQGADDSLYTFVNAPDVFSDYFNFNSIVLPANVTIFAVSVKYRARRFGGAGPNGASGALKVGGVNRLANFPTLTDAWVNYIARWETNPNTNKAWLKEDVEGSGSNPIQAFGYRLDALSGDSPTRCTSVYLEVEYETNKQTFDYSVRQSL